MILVSVTLPAAATLATVGPSTPVASSAQATATLIAAIVAGLGALLAAGVGLINASRNLAQVRREQWWQQFQWGIEKALSRDGDESDVGVAVLNKLVQRKEAREEDNEIALVVADLVTDRASRQRWWRRNP
ncbi:hypothetical protein IFT72_14935 [Frigoribacterium sp. CFBP 8754]|uniref:hypothetical protein n=1 Tax=Frigoribacterium sp. CFBP 8754 TaxID=2775290 RepID=UPI001786E03B|nr:hypothetical protein [Frigoribacterium sp. CFBP 8754]MBD8661482.1 hypothetical protein [Frigoribacterium sp. CFBP 8754]